MEKQASRETQTMFLKSAKKLWPSEMAQNARTDDFMIVIPAFVVSELQTGFDKKLITQVLPFVEFQASEEKYQNYFDKNADGQFCKTYIDPKLNLLRKQYSSLIRR